MQTKLIISDKEDREHSDKQNLACLSCPNPWAEQILPLETEQCPASKEIQFSKRPTYTCKSTNKCKN